ncbi:class I SAM-dependent methyltransferase [Patescibacteria group bacterium]
MDKLIKQWKKDEKAPFQGWNFSYIKRRHKFCEPPWDYIALARKRVKKATSVLDIATGGGEIFAKILSSFKPKKIVAIEGYKPNVTIARNNLKNFKVDVIFANETKKLPFKNGEFDLVLNRHGGHNILEIARILKPDGIFFTQQVDGLNWSDLMHEFGTKPKWPWNTLKNVSKTLKDSGFEIKRSEEYEGKTVFKDVGALVYVLKAVPWTVDDFTVEKYSAVLKRLNQKVKTDGRLEYFCKNFLIYAIKK